MTAPVRTAIASAVVAALALVGLVVVAPAVGAVSADCLEVDANPILDGTYALGSVGALAWEAGDTLTISTGPSNPPGTVASLYVDEVVVQAQAAPAVLQYTFPAAATVPVRWQSDPTGLTWTVSCTAAPPVGTIDVCVHPDLDLRAPYANGTCPSGNREVTVATVATGGRAVCVKTKTDWRAPYGNGSCPAGSQLVRVATVESGGELACFKVSYDVRAPDRFGCPSDWAAVRLATSAPVPV